MHRPNALADDAEQNHRRRVEVKNRFDIGTGFIDRLVQGRLGHNFIEVDQSEFIAFDYSRTLPRHEHHLVAVLAAQAEMSKRIAQTLPIDDSKRHDEIVFDGVIAFVDHVFVSPFHSHARP